MMYSRGISATATLVKGTFIAMFAGPRTHWNNTAPPKSFLVSQGYILYYVGKWIQRTEWTVKKQNYAEKAS